jgi:sirohydrochlorin cobaltochelatase
MSKKVILSISFGTSYKDTREKTIDALAASYRKEFSDYEVRQAYTSRFIIKKIAKNENVIIDTPTEALEKLKKEGYTEVICQPGHLINGTEYYKLTHELLKQKNNFEKFTIGKPLLTFHEDYLNVVDAVVQKMPDLQENEGVILMGHGTEHPINAVFPALDYYFKYKGFNNIYVGTVEGFPLIEDIIESIKDIQYEKIYLMPLMLVAGDHAKNDMAGEDDDSWKSLLEKENYTVEPLLRGLGEYPAIRNIFIKHIYKSKNMNE